MQRHAGLRGKPARLLGCFWQSARGGGQAGNFQACRKLRRVILHDLVESGAADDAVLKTPAAAAGGKECEASYASAHFGHPPAMNASERRYL